MVAAQILYEKGLSGIFFIPTCILEDNLPANPQIIHYSLACHGIEYFLKTYYKLLNKYKHDSLKKYIKKYERMDDPWQIIQEIKNGFKYSIPHRLGRTILTEIFKNLFKDNAQQMVREICLSKEDIDAILSMGHKIGVHSHSHVSVGGTHLSNEDIKNEIIRPKYILEREFGDEITAFSYPFGRKQDCLSVKHFIEKTPDYKFAFTTEEILNTPQTNPLQLGRYMPCASKETTTDLKNKIKMLE